MELPSNTSNFLIHGLNFEAAFLAFLLVLFLGQISVISPWWSKARSSRIMILAKIFIIKES